MAKKKENRPEISFHDVELGEVVVREMNDEEYAEYTSNINVYEAKRAEELEKEKLKELAISKLVALGMTEAELRAVLGE